MRGSDARAVRRGETPLCGDHPRRDRDYHASPERFAQPYELVAVAGGWQHRTKATFAEAIRTATGLGAQEKPPSQSDGLALIAIAYLQPITRAELGQVFGKEVSRDMIGHLRRLGFIAAGPCSPQPGAPYTYVTTPAFLSQFGLETLRDLPDIEALEDAGLLSKDRLLADMPISGSDEAEDEDDERAEDSDLLGETESGI